MALNKELSDFIDQSNEQFGAPVFRKNILEQQFISLGLEPDSVGVEDLRALQPVINQRIDDREAALGTVQKDAGTVQGSTPLGNVENAVLKPLTQDDIAQTAVKLADNAQLPVESTQLRSDEVSPVTTPQPKAIAQSAVEAVIPAAQAQPDIVATVQTNEDVTGESFNLRLKNILGRANIEGKEEDTKFFTSAVKAVVNDQIKQAKTEEDKFMIRLEATRFVENLVAPDKQIRTANRQGAAATFGVFARRTLDAALGGTQDDDTGFSSRQRNSNQTVTLRRADNAQNNGDVISPIIEPEGRIVETSSFSSTDNDSFIK